MIDRYIYTYILVIQRSWHTLGPSQHKKSTFTEQCHHGRNDLFIRAILDVDGTRKFPRLNAIAFRIHKCRKIRKHFVLACTDRMSKHSHIFVGEADQCLPHSARHLYCNDVIPFRECRPSRHHFVSSLPFDRLRFANHRRAFRNHVKSKFVHKFKTIRVIGVR